MRRKVNPLDIITILNLNRCGFLYSEIGKLYGVVPETISNIVRGKSWKYVYEIVTKS